MLQNQIDSFNILYDKYESDQTPLLDNELGYPKEVIEHIFYLYAKHGRIDRVKKYLFNEDKAIRDFAWDALTYVLDVKGKWNVHTNSGTQQVEIILDQNDLLIKFSSKIQKISSEDIISCQKISLDYMDHAIRLQYSLSGQEKQIFLWYGSSSYSLENAFVEELAHDFSIFNFGNGYQLDWYIWTNEIFPKKDEEKVKRYMGSTREMWQYATCVYKTEKCNEMVFEVDIKKLI